MAQGETRRAQGSSRKVVLDATELDAELQRVKQGLAARTSQGEERLALLRRQAALGDLRDALAQRARRAAL